MIRAIIFVALGLTTVSSLKWRVTPSKTSYRLSCGTGNVPLTPLESNSKEIFGYLKAGGVLAGLLTMPNLAFAAESVETPSESSDATAVVGDDGFITTSSGLKYRDIKAGDGASPQPGDTVRVMYTGWLDDFDSEKKFDSSYDRRSPLVFKVGVRQVIAGWDEGLLTNMKVGGKRELIIPASLGYGARGAGGVIPPNATLYFRIELVGIGAKANR